MRIITENESKGKVQDGIDTILNLEDEQFNEIIEQMTISKENKSRETIDLHYSTDFTNAKHGDFESPPSQKEVFSQLEKIKDEYNLNTNEYARCQKILKTRDVSAFKQYQINLFGNTDEKEEIVSKVVDMLDNEEMYEKFLNYEANKEEFRINGYDADIQKYLEVITNMFGQINDEKKFKKQYELTDSFYIENANDILKRTQGIYANYNVDKFFDEYTFEDSCYEENYEWNVNQELRDSVYAGMPTNLSTEEKVLYIYTKLCQQLDYDEEYNYNKLGIDKDFNIEFSKEKLENITPNSKVICFDFSRIFSKMVNDLNEDVEATLLEDGYHFLVGVHNDNFSTRFEAVNIQKDGINDFAKAKAGIELGGIIPFSDRQGIVKNFLENIYPNMINKQPAKVQDFIKELETIPINDVPNNSELKLQTFCDVMKANNIEGNSFVQLFLATNRTGFFGEEVEKALVGKRIEENGKKHIQREILIRIPQGSTGKKNLYMIDTYLQTFEPKQKSELIEKLGNGELVFENEKYKIELDNVTKNEDREV